MEFTLSLSKGPGDRALLDAQSASRSGESLRSLGRRPDGVLDRPAGAAGIVALAQAGEEMEQGRSDPIDAIGAAGSGDDGDGV